MKIFDMDGARENPISGHGLTLMNTDKSPFSFIRVHLCSSVAGIRSRPVSHARARGATDDKNRSSVLPLTGSTWITPDSTTSGVRSLDTARTSACATGGARRGSALLAVLWLSAALAAIGFSLATTIHGETERTSTALDGLRSYYLAAAGIDRAAVEALWSVQNPAARTIPEGATQVTYHFASGDVRVEFIPEAAKLNVNRATLEDLTRLGMALGLDEVRADGLAHAIDQARTGAGGPPELTQGPSFQPSAASLQEIEELLSVPGVTPELFYGTYGSQQNAAGGMSLTRSAGLVDCLTVYGRTSQVDVNTASPAVLAAVGMNPGAIGAVVARRNAGPILQDQLGDVAGMAGEAAGRLRVGGRSIVTLRATARLRLDDGRFSDLRRTVAAMVKYMPPGYDAPIHILRWYDTAWSE
jgi:general secretion pathway protein K